MEKSSPPLDGSRAAPPPDSSRAAPYRAPNFRDLQRENAYLRGKMIEAEEEAARLRIDVAALHERALTLGAERAALSQDLHTMLAGMSLAAPGAAGSDGGGGVGGADGSAVAQAVRVGVALQTGDFRSFFRELRQMHNLGAEIIKPLIPAQRRTALEKICRAYQPSLPVARIATLLGFAGGAAEAGPWLRGLRDRPRPTDTLHRKRELDAPVLGSGLAIRHPR